MINHLIEKKKIEIFLQAIISIKDKKIFAYEAFTRAYDDNDDLISPLYLFDQARKERLSCELDEYVRELALEKFSPYYHENKELLLFLNFEPSIIDNDMYENFIPIVYKHNIATSNIVIEIKEDKIKNTQALKKFISKYKSKGFLIAIDDFGTDYSSFDRLEYIKPDIVKVDRSIIYNIHNNFINSEILSAISNMCHEVGAIVVAEGVENSSEVLSCMKKDIDIFQGYWFAKPSESIDPVKQENIAKSINKIGNTFKTIIKEGMSKKQLLLDKSKMLSKKIIDILETHEIDNLETVDDVFFENDKLEAIYLLNYEDGVQVGRTFIHAAEKYLYKPTQEGHDHSLRDYYFIAKDSSRGDYLGKRYVSKASGNMCRTYASKITVADRSYIVCLDILD
ncbi:MAG: EAL domain-containing protein [Sulfurimonas sp.]|nr:EAL domain-containing protein [Sulfurimonas sp.]